jgi:3'-5' exoribonuclease
VAATPEKVWIRDLTPGQLVDSTFAVLRKERRRTRSGSPFLSLELADRTGRIRGMVFQDAAVLDGRFGEGDTVRVLGETEDYRGRVQLVVRGIERAPDGDPLELVPGARRDVEDLDGFVEFLAGEIVDTTLRALTEGVYAEQPFRMRLRTAPATLDGHHAYAGGALEHTVAVASLCREAAQLQPRLDVSVLGAAALLFCVGAADAFPPGPTLRLSDEGRLLGVAHLSARRVERHAERARTPRERLVPVLHAIESPRPRTPEAACLHGAIALDAAVADALRAAAGAGAAG